MTMPVLLDDDMKWMKWLQAEIWIPPAPSRGLRAPPNAPTLIRVLNSGEWDRVVSVIEIHKLPVTVINVNFCFGIALAVYEHSPLREVKPEFLLCVSYEQLPKAPTDVRERWEAAWNIFEPLMRSCDNLEVLAFYGMEMPEDRVHYEY